MKKLWAIFFLSENNKQKDLLTFLMPQHPKVMHMDNAEMRINIDIGSLYEMQFPILLM